MVILWLFVFVFVFCFCVRPSGICSNASFCFVAVRTGSFIAVLSNRWLFGFANWCFRVGGSFDFAKLWLWLLQSCDFAVGLAFWLCEAMALALRSCGFLRLVFGSFCDGFCGWLGLAWLWLFEAVALALWSCGFSRLALALRVYGCPQLAFCLAAMAPAAIASWAVVAVALCFCDGFCCDGSFAICCGGSCCDGF